MRLHILFFFITICSLQNLAAGQQLQSSGSPVTLSDQAFISLITVYPGNQIHAFWGHSALRVRDPLHGIDLMYNYGGFLFDQAFVPKFVYGKLDYILSVSHMRRELERYTQYERRTLVEQQLALDAEQRQIVFEFLENNALPDNRTYRYDFLFDNCSTRIRDIIENIYGQSLRYDESLAPERTWRQILVSYVEHFPFLKLGIDLGLALPVDQVPTSREIMGLPMNYMDAYDAAMIDSAGTFVPLVTRKDTLIWIEPEPTSSASSTLMLNLIVWGLFAFSLIVSNSRKTWMKRVRIWYDRFLFGLLGLTGMLAVFLWFVALHEVTNQNWNLLWAWPTHFLILPFLSERRNWLVYYMRVCAIVGFITVLGWYFWPQELNATFIPVVLAVLVRNVWWGWGQPEGGGQNLESKLEVQGMP